MSTLAGYLSGGAALLAAVLSAVSLTLTRRWQRADLDRNREWQESRFAEEARARTKTWVLDNLKTALIDHINLSFMISRACSDGREAAARGSARDELERAIDLHARYLDLMVYLRLFGTPAIVKGAESLHVHVDHLLDLTFSDELAARGRRRFTVGGQLPRGLDEAKARAACMDSRETLLNEVRAYLGLARDAEIDRSV